MDLLLCIDSTVVLASLVYVDVLAEKKPQIAAGLAFAVPQLLLSPFAVTNL